jgi:hypothetical protein
MTYHCHGDEEPGTMKRKTSPCGLSRGALLCLLLLPLVIVSFCSIQPPRQSPELTLLITNSPLRSGEPPELHWELTNRGPPIDIWDLDFRAIGTLRLYHDVGEVRLPPTNGGTIVLSRCIGIASVGHGQVYRQRIQHERLAHFFQGLSPGQHHVGYSVSLLCWRRATLLDKLVAKGRRFLPGLRRPTDDVFSRVGDDPADIPFRINGSGELTFTILPPGK